MTNVVPTDIQVTFCAAALLADVGARSIEAARKHSERRLTELYSRFRWRALAYASVVIGPSATVFFLAWPGWESQYWSPVFETTRENPINSMYYAIFLAALFLGAWVGCWLGFRWVLTGARKRLRVLYVSIMILTVALVLGRWPAPVRLGGYEGFRADIESLPFIWEDRTFFTTFWVLLFICIVPMVIWYIQVWRDARRTA